MKDLNSSRLMKWLTSKGIPPHKAYDLIGISGFGSFMLSVLVSIIAQEIELSGWLGILCNVLALILMLGLLAVSGYLTYQANGMWLMLLLFGPCNIVMGIAIDLGDIWRSLFLALGIVMTGIGIYLTPKQLRNSKKLKPELEAAQKQWERERIAQSRKKQEVPKTTKDAGPKTQSSEIDQLKIQLHVLKNMKDNLNTAGGSERLKEAEKKYDAAAEQLGKKLLEQPQLWVLVCNFRGDRPVYLGSDGRMEIFTDHALAEAGQSALLRLMHVETDIRSLEGPKAIRDFFADCAHKGFQVLRLDNGSQFVSELWLKNFFPFREEQLIDEKNRSLRYMFCRAKLYSWMLGGRCDMQNPRDHSLAEMMMTMQLNGYRELGNTLVYALGNLMPENRIYATRAALEKLEKWLPGSGYEESTIIDTPAYDVKLQLGFVNRPGEQGNIKKGMLCIFTDIAQAKKAQAMFRSSGMDHSIVAITFEELLSQAVQCAGIVVDMQTISYEIPKEEYAKVDELRKLDGPVLVNLKQEGKKEKEVEHTESAAQQRPGPRLMKAEMKGGWKQFDYQWPHRFGYDYMLKNAQWLISHDLQVQTLTTAEIAGAPEKEHIEELRSSGSLFDCVGRETGVLAVGGAGRSVDGLLKVCWYNQTNVVRIFTLGDMEESRINAFADRLCEAKEETP